MEGFTALAKNEGIIPALESSHAVYAAMQIARTLRPDQDVLVGLSGRGDKGNKHSALTCVYNSNFCFFFFPPLSDMMTVAKVQGVTLN
jgi:tryptophan synthase beta subunit